MRKESTDESECHSIVRGELPMENYDTFWRLRWNWIFGFNVIDSRREMIRRANDIIKEAIRASQEMRLKLPEGR